MQYCLASLLALLGGLNLCDRRACVVSQSHQSRCYRCGVCRGVPQGYNLGLFSLFINDLPASPPSSVSCFLYAEDLTIWSSSPSVTAAVEATQGAVIRLEGACKDWCLPLNLSKCETSFSVDPLQAYLRPHLILFNLFYSNFFWGHLRPHSFLF